MKIAILGCGAMGSVYAGLLASAGHEVWAVDTWREHVDAMRAKGLHLEGASGDRTVKVNATLTASDAGVCDLVIIATKARDVETAARAAKSLLGPQTLVLSIQNGLGGPDVTASVLGRERVAVGVVGGFGASMRGPGHAHHNGMELVRLGELSGPVSPRLEAVAEVWRSGGFKVKCFDDIDQLVWEKLICNVCFSGTCAVTERTVGEVMEDPDAWIVASGCAAGGVRGRAQARHQARLRRAGRLRARLRLEDPERAPVDAARPDGEAPLRDRRDQRRDPAGGEGGRARRAVQRGDLGAGAGEGAAARLRVGVNAPRRSR